VVANLSRAAREGVEIDVRYDVGAGRRLAHDEIGERLRSVDAPAEPGALARPVARSPSVESALRRISGGSFGFAEARRTSPRLSG